MAGAVSLAASFVAPNPAHAETTPGMPAKCYQWPLQRLDVAWSSGKLFRTDPIEVTPGSPCADINVRAVLDVDGRPTCRTLRVVFDQTGAKGRWRRVCKRWVVLYRGAEEGDVYRIESKGRPSTVGVRG
ncbi:hypothetical protein GCM10010199_62970 [Dactylosporangium roseum]